MQLSARARVFLAMSDGTDEHEEAAPSVDGTLIEEMLRLSPAERLRQNDRAAALAVRLQEAFSARTAAKRSRK
jgi:hypothetical protein